MIDFMTAKKTDFKKLPHINSIYGTDEEFDSIIIILERTKHDSGFMCMSFVGCKEEKATCIMGGGSDVINIDGIGGYGERKSKVPDKVPPKGWAIDCLPCGCLRIFIPGGKITIGSMLSNFEIFGKVKRK